METVRYKKVSLLTWLMVITNCRFKMVDTFWNKKKKTRRQNLNDLSKKYRIRLNVKILKNKYKHISKEKHIIYILTGK